MPFVTQNDLEAIQDRINEELDIEQLRERSLVIVELLSNVDKMVGLLEEKAFVFEHKANGYHAVATGLIEMIEINKEIINNLNIPVLNELVSYDKAIAAAKAVLAE